MIVEPKDTVAPHGWKLDKHTGADDLEFDSPNGRVKYTAVAILRGNSYMSLVQCRGSRVCVVFSPKLGWRATAAPMAEEHKFLDFPWFDTCEEAVTHLLMVAEKVES